MSNPTPVIRVFGEVHSTVERDVQPQPFVEAERDENNRVVKPQREARDGYSVTDVTILTEKGGFATVLLHDDALEAFDGERPAVGSKVDGWPVRCYVAWRGQAPRRYTVVGFSVATDVLVAEAKKPAGSRSLSSASAAS